MRQFVIPQFIDVEDKIIGPITTRQFVIMLIASILVAICYKLADFTLFIVEGFLIFTIFGIVAFLKINGRPFHFFLINFIETTRKSKLRIWNLSEKNIDLESNSALNKVENIKKGEEQKVINKSRLSELSLIVDTGGRYED